jgi:CRP/FNR family transcriptional regulator, anaerobic regulatory protein
MINLSNYVAIDFFKNQLNTSDDEWAMIIPRLRNNRYPKGSILLSPGQISKRLYLLDRGIVRSFYYDERGEEMTSWFAAEGEFGAGLESFLRERPSESYLQVIEDCSVWEISYSDLQYLVIHSITFCKFYLQLLEADIIGTNQHIKSIQASTPEQRYQWFLEGYKHIANRLPVKYIANFLGINKFTLSHLRSGMKKKEQISKVA